MIFFPFQLLCVSISSNGGLETWYAALISLLVGLKPADVPERLSWICFLGLELHYLLSVIFSSLINSNESFICFASLCYFRSTLLSYLHSVCTQDSFRCLFTTVFGLYLNPCSSQWAEHVAPSVKTRIEVMLHFIHFPSETTDRYQPSLTVFVQVCLHTVKRNGNVRTTHHLDSEVHCFKDESRCFVDLTVLHTQNFLPSSINLLSFFTNEAVSTLINNLFTCISCILLPRFSISNTRLNSLCFLEDEKHDGTFRILSVCLLHDCSEPWSAGDRQFPLLVITWLRWWRIQFAMQSWSLLHSSALHPLCSLVELDPSWSVRRSPVVLPWLPFTQTNIHSLCWHCKWIQGFRVFSRQESLGFNRKVSPRMHLCHLQEPRHPLLHCQHMAQLIKVNQTLTQPCSPPL